jgi:hypothetical protein
VSIFDIPLMENFVLTVAGLVFGIIILSGQSDLHVLCSFSVHVTVATPSVKTNAS